MHKIQCLVIVLFFYCQSAQSQYYLLDHINQRESAANYARLVQQKIKMVRLTSIDRNGETDPEFSIEQLVDARARMLQTTSKAPESPSSILTVYFDEANRPVINIDSVEGSKTTVQFYYSKISGLLDSAVSVATTSLQDYVYMEKRQYQYNAAGFPEQMFWIRNKLDTTIVLFDAENGKWPEMERWFKKDVRTESYYYYYDEDNRLTDLVKWYRNVDKLLPVNVFAYNEDGSLLMQTNFLPGSNDYTIYQYTYNANGLRNSESVFNKAKQQIGRVVYTYSQ